MTLEELEKEVIVLEDIKEIEELQRNYIIWLDSHEWDKLFDCFAENITVEIARPPVTGKEAVIKLFRDDISKTGSPAGGHIMEHPIIDVEGDRAKGCWTMYRLFYYFVAPTTISADFLKGRKEGYQGRYDCEYVREDGKWKFSSILWTRAWPD
jgi:hypothetical protein